MKVRIHLDPACPPVAGDGKCPKCGAVRVHVVTEAERRDHGRHALARAQVAGR